MGKNRTSEQFRRRFNSNINHLGGYVAAGINDKFDSEKKKTIREEGRVRRELQTTIRELAMERKTVEEMKNYLLQDDRYKFYEKYYDIWIEEWVLKVNISIKSIIIKLISANKTKEEILKEVEQEDIELYGLYKGQIENKIIELIKEQEIRKIEIDRRRIEREEKKKREKEEEER